MKNYLPETFVNLRVQLGRTQAEMARLLGVSVSTWVSWEKGHRQPKMENYKNLDTLLRYAQGRMMK